MFKLQTIQDDVLSSLLYMYGDTSTFSLMYLFLILVWMFHSSNATFGVQSQVGLGLEEKCVQIN